MLKEHALALSFLDWVITGLLAGVFVAGHFLAPRLVSMNSTANQVVNSLAAGVSIAFVFGNMLPRLAQGGALLQHLNGNGQVPSLLVESGLFFTALAGLLVIYSFQVRGANGGSSPSPSYGFRITIFAFMSLMYGFSLPAFVLSGWDYAALLTVVMVAHTMARDRILAMDHPERYASKDRWIGLIAVVAGVITAMFLPPVNPLVLLLPLAFLSGSLLMTTFRSEMPSPTKVKLKWLLLSAATTTLILIAAAYAAQ